MPKLALQTRQIGLQPHYSRHPLAPMEVVYEVEKPRVSLKDRLSAWLTVVSIVGIATMAFVAFRDAIVNGAEPWFWPAMGVLGSLYCGAYALRRR